MAARQLGVEERRKLERARAKVVKSSRVATGQHTWPSST